MAEQYKVVTSLYADTYKTVDADGKGKTKNNTVLMGSYVKELANTNGNWQQISAFGITGWIDKTCLGKAPGFKCYFLDCGQGGSELIEIGDDKKGLKIIIDGGPCDNLTRYLNKWQYKFYLNKGEKIHIDYVFISHFDKDHYNGLIDLLNDDHYTFGTIFHNGIAKFDDKKETFPERYNTTLGIKEKEGKEYYLTTSFDSINDLSKLKEDGGMLDLLENFENAVKNAFVQDRLTAFKRMDYKSPVISMKINDVDFTIQPLAPVTSVIPKAPFAFKYFKDESHTINGHSLVLKLTYGITTFLFGGDLNIPSEAHLLDYYKGKEDIFRVDVAKACHHGASEFKNEFLAATNPLATVFSSGDNESFAHPRADALGCAGKYSRSERPLVFSTELARSTNVETDKIKYGMINLRSDGKNIIMAQMKEASKKGNFWDLYPVV